MEAEPIDPNLTTADLLVLQNLLGDVENDRVEKNRPSQGTPGKEAQQSVSDDQETVQYLQALNSPDQSGFEPTVFMTWDIKDLKSRAHPIVNKWILQPYIQFARKIVRVETDVVMLTHLILYFTTSVPSAILLFRHFSWIHGVLHWIMQSYYVGTFTLMMHQHIHMGGVLNQNFWLFDGLFPYILYPLFGHTWNSYYYHHVKHHHVEGNGPDDLSSTIRYQRDNLVDFLCYVGRFFFFIWLELPLYFARKGNLRFAARAAFWEIGNYVMIYAFWNFVNWKATLFVLLLPLLQLRVGLMVGNWGQHALVDEVEPTSDFRSSITLIDVPSNRFCFNDGYHTSHHLNPRRHWRDHPVSFMQQKDRYSSERALVLRNIDYIMLTIMLLRKNYKYIAKCVVPIGDQKQMSLDEIAAMLQMKTQRFSEEKIRQKFNEGK